MVGGGWGAGLVDVTTHFFSDIFKLVQTFQNFQTFSDFLKRFQMFSDIFRLFQTFSDFFRLVPL